jgi:hypothetical protein
MLGLTKVEFAGRGSLVWFLSAIVVAIGLKLAFPKQKRKYSPSSRHDNFDPSLAAICHIGSELLSDPVFSSAEVLLYKEVISSEACGMKLA